MYIHILGICGTFMGGVAALAKAQGHEVTGSDENVYPPMSTQLESLGIKVYSNYLILRDDKSNCKPREGRGDEPGISDSVEGFSQACFASPGSKAKRNKTPDLVIIGNVIKRGNPELEYVLNQNIPYTSGPQWLAENILRNYWVLAVAGTHGKTTTAAMLAWILEYAGKNPSFLIGGVTNNFPVSSRLTRSAYFVIEADEYDSAYFDKRSKFIHYLAKTLILNNLEFDHADIFKDLEDIKKQFHHLVRTIPGNGLIVQNGQDSNLSQVIKQGCWTPRVKFNDAQGWHAKLKQADGSVFEVGCAEQSIGVVNWGLLGNHNVSNALAAIAAAQQVGVAPDESVAALNKFSGVKRRLELRGQLNGAAVYDDFAHHPTAIQKTLAGLRHHVSNKNIIAVIEFGSYTMRSGKHSLDAFVQALQQADEVYFKQPQHEVWHDQQLQKAFAKPVFVFDTTKKLIKRLQQTLTSQDCLLVMSNTGFDNFFSQLLG